MLVRSGAQVELAVVLVRLLVMFLPVNVANVGGICACGGNGFS